MDLKEAAQFDDDQGRHWYYASKANALIQALGDAQPQRILDVGAGTGFFSRVLLRRTAAREAVCVDLGYDREWMELERTKPITFRRAGSTGEADLVLFMDVLEHVDDDVGLLAGFVSAARPGTRFIISVPAFSWLWSRHDEFLEHRRRYTLRSIVDVVERAGLEPGTGFYMFAAILPAVAVLRLWRRRTASQTPGTDLRQHHWLTNAALTQLCTLESTVARHNRAFGLTVFAVADKL